ncbi:MAG: DNA repair protein RecN [Clostridiales Family XIII bacterium]|jgi:DNA repair protein RecN (Recombination protein N)|nr:DNA repair protein RecN [Clostridiales Family XIII bacterium]
MITHILIRDFAIIEEIDVDLSGGLSIITGETGAGKSIIIEAISMALGARADTAMVRKGREKARIQIIIDETELPEGDRVGVDLLSRDISKEGKSVCRVDGEIVTLAYLKEATARVADIHGQYDHQSLLDPRNHLGVVDDFRSDLISAVRAQVGEAWKKYSAAKRSLDRLLADEARSRREFDLLRFEVGEIDAARLRLGEYETLKDELKVMQNSERIYESLSSAYDAISGGATAASDSLARAIVSLRAVSDISDEYLAMGETVSDAAYALDELAGLLRDKLDSLDFSEQAINDAVARIDVLERLMSKYGGSVENVHAHRDRAAARLDDIGSVEETKERLTKELAAAESTLAAESLKLSHLRRKAAEELEEGVTEQLRELNFSDAVFSVSFARDYGKDGMDGVSRTSFAEAGVDAVRVDPADFSENGIDEAEFLIAANKGQPPLPVARAASGGEMSRIMLALKSVVGEFDRIPTMIFDEIDVGVSGVTASVVGEKLKRMALNRQIICITHLPQIAAFADRHYVIEKRSDDSDTYTTVTELTDEGRVAEIARLIGGSTVTATTMDSARELIAASYESV